LARALVTLAERDEADGQVWHLPSADPLTGRQFLTLIFEAAGHRPKIGVASRPMIRLAWLFNPLPRELNETLYQFEQPFICDASKFQRAFGPLQPTPHADAVQRTVEWFRRRYPACETNPRCAPRRPQGVVGDLLRDCAHRGDPNHTRALSRILPAAGSRGGREARRTGIRSPLSRRADRAGRHPHYREWKPLTGLGSPSRPDASLRLSASLRDLVEQYFQ
jgi:hypothetical protein